MLQFGPGSRNTHSVPGIFQEVFYLGSFHICPAQRYVDKGVGARVNQVQTTESIGQTPTNEHVGGFGCLLAPVQGGCGL